MKFMIGAILCGGFGKRLKPLTDNLPKPLLEIKKNYTILDKQILQFKYAGINKVVLLCGHLHEKIQERFGSSWNGMEINYLIEEEPRGTLYAINNLLENFEDKEINVKKNKTIGIEHGTPLTILALEITILQEYSTPHLDDTIRIKDR